MGRPGGIPIEPKTHKSPLRTLRPLHIALLSGIAVVAPVVGFAGVSVVWPSSSMAIDVQENPLITFTPGADHTTAHGLGYAGAFVSTDNGAA